MQFKDIIGQEEVKERLRAAVREGRVPHAQLFSGPAGVGKLQLAIAYAQYLACPNRTEQDSCGYCPSCMQYRNLQHPDLHFAFPITTTESIDKPVCNDFVGDFRQMLLEKGYFDMDDWHAHLSERYKKVETKQLMIYERESSEILRKLSLKSYGDGYKTMIIWLPEKMNEVCANKLLKILEEPPTDTLFLLVSNEPQRLLATILSRVQQISVPHLNEDEVADALRERMDVSIEDSIDFAHMAGGSYLRAKKIAANDATNARFLSLFQTAMRSAWSVGHKQDYAALITLRDWASEVAKMGREQEKAFLDYCMSQVRENFITNFAQPSIIYQTQEERRFSSRFAPFIHEGNVEKLLDQFALAQRQIEQNANANIVFFDVALQLIVLIK